MVTVSTHTHVCFCELGGHSIGVMFFILYKLHFLLPYTNPNPKPSLSKKIKYKFSLDPKKDNDFRYCYLCGVIPKLQSHSIETIYLLNLYLSMHKMIH